MDGLMQVFPIMMYVLGSILLVVTIILVIKLIYTVDKANEILDNVEAKVKTLDGFFNAINMTSSAISSIGDRIIGAVAGLLGKFKRKKKTRTLYMSTTTHQNGRRRRPRTSPAQPRKRASGRSSPPPARQPTWQGRWQPTPPCL